MLRSMVFVDHMNFDIALQDYYKSMGKSTPKLDYNKVFKNVGTLSKLLLLHSTVDNHNFVDTAVQAYL